MESKILNKVQPAISILGGTFDPVHHGHLRIAVELAEQLGCSHTHLMPGYQPVHRQGPKATAEQRLTMLRLASENCSHLVIDEREIKREGPSYTILSMQEIRAEVGTKTPIYFILGEDAFCHLDQWHQWQNLTDYVHLLVAGRPGHHPEMSDQLKDFCQQHEYQGSDFPQNACGSIVWLNNEMLEISSSEIRSQRAENKSIRYLTPENVCEYINKHKIYQ